MDDFSNKLNKSLARLEKAVDTERSDKYRLRLWSNFIRLRDGEECIVCGSTDRTAAHHIFRKSFFSWARCETGNGITLCKICHRKPHKEFNRKPNVVLPMDCEGGENIDLSIFYLSQLLSNALARGLLNDQHYFLSDRTLVVLKRLQGIKDDLIFPGYRLEQADLIWRQTPRNMMSILLGSVGLNIPDDLIQMGPLMDFYIYKDDG